MPELWRRAQHGWPARYPLAQFPNAPLLAAIAARAVTTRADGPARAAARTVSQAAAARWAWLELTQGVNAVRRVYGLAGLALVARDVRQG